MRHIFTVAVLVCAICCAQTASTITVAPQDVASKRVESTTTGVLQGTVTDGSGAVLIGAVISISNAGGVVQTATAAADGKFEVRGLAPGSYTISVKAPKFQEFKSENFNLSLEGDNYLEVILQPAAETTNIDVTGQSNTQVETEKAELSGTITEQEIKEVPLNGQNFAKAINLTPGVTDTTQQDEAKVGVQGSAKYSVNGGRVEYNTWDVDGSNLINPNIAASRGQTNFIVYPALDAIEEMKVLSSNYGSQYGGSASGTVLITTKSGTQSYHGTAYELAGNNIFNARGFLDPAGSAPLYKRNNFGFTIGGPIFIPKTYNTDKQKDFFFFSESVRLEQSPIGPGNQYGSFSHAVPSLSEREGNFSDVCPAAPLGASVNLDRTKYPDCPVGGLTDSGTGYATFRGNIIPVDPNAQALLGTNLIPLANSATGCNVKLNLGAVTSDPVTWPCYNASISPKTYWRQELFTINHNFTPGLKASFAYIHDSWNTTVVTPQWQYGGVGLQQNTFPTVLNDFIGPGISMVGHLLVIRGSSFLNDFSLSFTRQHVTLSPLPGPGSSLTRPAQIDGAGGIGCLFTHTNSDGSATCLSDGKLPGIYLGGSNQSLGGTGLLADTSYMPYSYSNPTVTLRDSLSKVIGRHTLQAGVTVVGAQQTEVSAAIGANSGDVQGIVAFSNVSNQNTTGNSLADFEANGRQAIHYFQQDSAQPTYTNRYFTYEPFVQDDWHVRPNLTLNLGIRLSLFGNWTPHSGTTYYNFEPSAYNFNLAQSLVVNPTSGYLQDISGTPIPINVAHPDPRTVNGLVQCGVNGVPASCMASHLFNPAPRIGFAWDPRGDGKTSIRAGYGIFFEHGTSSEANSASLIGNAPAVLSMVQDGSFASGSFGWTCIGGQGTNCGASAGAAYPLNVVAVPSKATWPYAQQWSLSVQRELAPKTMATLAYVGSKGTHLTTLEQINQLPPVAAQDNFFGPTEPIYAKIGSSIGVCTPFNFPEGGTGYIVQNGHIYLPSDPGYVNLQIACSAIDANTQRKYPGYGSILSLQNIANSSYNALQFTLRHTSRALTVGAAYTYGHSIDEGSDRYETTLGNSLDPASNRASSDFDQRHNLTVSYLYRLPLFDLVGKVHNLLNCSEADSISMPDCAGHATAVYGGPSRLTRMLLANWDLSGLTTFQSGTPFSIVNGGSSLVGVLDNAGVANGMGFGSYPDIQYGRRGCYPNQGGIGPLLGNPCDFVAPRGLTFGDAGRNYMRNPSYKNFDMSLSRQFSLPREYNLEFRMTAYNVFNLSEFRIFNPDIGNTASNTITCYGDASTGYSAGAPSCATNSSFLRPVDAHRPRILQFALKFAF